MIILDKRKYERIVSELIDTQDIRELAERYSLDRVYYYHILKDISLGERSPNHRLLRSIAQRRKLSEDFVMEQAKSVLNFYVPYYQGLHSDPLDYYKILNVSRNATDEEIRRSWIELMKAHHPDKAGAQGLDTAKKINEAYEVLSSGSKREAYDNRHLPPTPVIVPQNEMKKYYYAGAFMVVVFLVVMYASGSGLIFQSVEEKERLAREFETPSIPNTVYKGDYLDSEKVDRKISEIKPIEEARETGEKVAVRGKEAEKAAGEKEPGSEKKIESAAREEKAEEAVKIAGVAPVGSENETSPAESAPVKEQIAEKDTLVAKTEAEAPAVLDGEDAGNVSEAPPTTETGQKSASPDLKDDALIAGNGEEAKDEQKAASDIKKVEKEKSPEIELAEKPAAPAETKGEPAEISAPKKETSPSAGEYYTVEKGDSLWSIAHKFGMTTGELERLNDLTGSRLDIGDKILISGTPVIRPKPAPAVVAKKEAEETAIPTEKEKLPETAVSKVTTLVNPPAKTDITADFNPKLATSAVAVHDTAVREPEPIPPAATPDRDSVYGFVSDYVSAYKNRDIDRVKSLFAPDAVENGVSISRVLSSYSSNFSNFDIVKYDVKVRNISVEDSLGYVWGEFSITFKDQRTGTLKSSKGKINWTLSWTDGSWKIRELTYKIENTDTVG